MKVDRSDFCKPCKENLEVEHANVIYGDQSAFVKCNDGFKIHGNPFVFCLRTSKWDLNNLPSCKIVKCEILKTPANGRMQLTKLSYKGTAKFRCEEGFKLVGSETLTCEGSGKWSDKVPFCKSIFECPALDEPINGILIYASDSGIITESYASYPLGTFAEIKCKSGFSTENDNLITCMDNGVWDFEVDDCEPDAVTEKVVDTTSTSTTTEIPKSSSTSIAKTGKMTTLSTTASAPILKTSTPARTTSTSTTIKPTTTSTTTTRKTTVATTTIKKPPATTVKPIIATTTTTEKPVPTTISIPIKVPTEFWKELKEFLFQSCKDNKPELCKTYNTDDFNSDLSTFELPETKEFEGMDFKLFNLLKSLSHSDDLNVGDFIKILLGDLIKDQPRVDSFRFVFCLYIDLILLDEELGIVDDESVVSANINTEIKRIIRKKVKIMYGNYLRM